MLKKKSTCREWSARRVGGLLGKQPRCRFVGAPSSEFVSFTSSPRALSFGLSEQRAPAAGGRRGSEAARVLLALSGAGHRLGTHFLGNNDFLLDLCL